MSKYVYIMLAMLCCLGSCDEVVNEYDPYEDWQARNAVWFEDTVAVARQAIAEAKQTYGDRWEEHCSWRMFKTLYKTTTSTGPVTDSICVRIINPGADTHGKGSPLANDSVLINLRGWLMPTQDYTGNGSDMGLVQKMFTTTYYGDYNVQTSSPQLVAVNTLVAGFSTALQYMVEGDECMVFMPQNLAYGAASQGAVRPYSTLQFHIHMIRWYESGTGI